MKIKDIYATRCLAATEDDIIEFISDIQQIIDPNFQMN